MNDHVPPACFIVPRQKMARFPSGEVRGRKTPSALAACSPVSTALSGSLRGKRIARDWGFCAARLIHSVSRPSAIGLQPAANAFPEEEIWELAWVVVSKRYTSVEPGPCGSVFLPVAMSNGALVKAR